MHDVFPPPQHDFVIVYLDGILIFSQDQEQHLDHVIFVLDQLRKHELKAKSKKTAFYLDQVEYLGHIVQKGTVCADPSKIVAVAEQPVPTDVKQLQIFFGLGELLQSFHLPIHTYSRTADITIAEKRAFHQRPTIVTSI